MLLLAFPSLILTEADETAIAVRAAHGGYYTCKRTVNEDGEAAIKLLDRERAVSGFITKKHGFYCVLDPDRNELIKSRDIDDVLCVLSK